MHIVDMSYKPNVLIFASDKSTTEVLLLCEVLNIPVWTLLGKWKGEYETSYMVSFEYYDTIKEHSMLDTQNSVLALLESAKNGSREAFLIEMDAPYEASHLGQLIAVDRVLAMNEDGATYHPSEHQWYIIK